MNTVEIIVDNVISLEVGVTGPGRKGDPGTTDYLELGNRPDAEIAQGVEAFGWGNHADAGYALQSSLSDVATTGDYNDLINTPTIPQGDMEKGVYDPNNKEADAFSMNNMEEGVNSKIFTQEERTKLTGIAVEATKNDSDAQLRDRSTHTGVQPISSVQGLQGALDDKVDSEVGKGLSTEDYTTAEKTKLSGIATGATANATDAQLRDRSTHTGVQPISSVTGLQTSLNSKLENITNLVQAGDNVSLTGDGTAISPYVISGGVIPLNVRTEVSAVYSVQETDVGAYIILSSVDPISVTIPASSAVPVGYPIYFVGESSEVELTPDVGVTLRTFYEYPTTTIYEKSVFSLMKESADVWRVVGFEKEEE